MNNTTYMTVPEALSLIDERRVANQGMNGTWYLGNGFVGSESDRLQEMLPQYEISNVNGYVNAKPAATIGAPLFAELDATQTVAFQKWARDNYQPFRPIDGLWHPIIQLECIKMNQEVGK